MGGIFISYRRGDSGPYAGRLRDTLSNHFGAEQVFRDIDTINPGERFPRVIEQAVGSCDALVAVIGPRWLSIEDDAGRRRLDDPGDYARLEIATALGRSDVLVIPVLVGPTSMPAAAELPKPLAALAECNAVRITDESWDDQVARLTRALEKVVKPRVVAPPSTSGGQPPNSARSNDELGKVPRKGWRRLLTLPGAMLVVALTTLVTFGATALANYITERVQAQNPLSISVETDPEFISGQSSAGSSAVIPSHVTTHGNPGPLGCLGFYKWVRENKGVSEGQTVVQLVLQGRSDSVLVTGLRVEVRNREPPIKGIPVECPTAGTLEFREASVDLDAVAPVITYPSSLPRRSGVTIAKGESEAFVISATTHKTHCQWVILVDLIVKGTPRTLEVSDGGIPFETTAAVSSAHWAWNYTDQWELAGGSGAPPSISQLPSTVTADTPLPPLP